MEKVLLISACARPDSRTFRLAGVTVRNLSADFSVIDLYNENLQPLDRVGISKREGFIEKNDFSDEMFRFAKEFSEADEIVIAAPYWDLSFPSILKCYFEAICVNGITFKYSEEGRVIPLCKGKRLIYVTTAGGYIGNHNYGFEYVKAVCSNLFGIENTVCISAEGLDIIGNNVEEILIDAENKIKNLIG